jgi:ankyrin repeat protein
MILKVLIRSCLKGRREIVLLLIEEGGDAIDLNSAEVTQGSTVLHWAVFEGYLDIVGAILNQLNSKESISAIIQKKDNQGRDAITIARERLTGFKNSANAEGVIEEVR